MKQFTKLKINIVRLFILVNIVNLETEWMNTKDAEVGNIYIYIYIYILWNKATILSSFLMS